MTDSTHLIVGQHVSLPELRGARGEPVRLSARGLTHLQFRRFAGCPVCNLHLRSFARAAAQLRVAGVHEVVLFHARADELTPHIAELPFPVIADPDKQLYRRFGVEASRRALLDPRVWPTILRAVLYSLWLLVREGRPAPSLMPTGGRWGLPADFLLDADGRILALKYGEHADDQWSVTDVLEHAARTTTVSFAAV